MNSANQAWTMYLGPHGAYEACTRTHRGAEEALPGKLTSATGPARCSDRAQCGTDLGLLHQGRTAGRRHVRYWQQDFHLRRRDDMMENIGHPSSPACPTRRGVERHLALRQPKWKVKPDGLMARGTASVGGLDTDGHPRQRHGADRLGSRGTLVGEPNKGLAAMFRDERGAPGRRHAGPGPTEVVYQNAAPTRRTGSDALARAQGKDKPADPMSSPDVGRCCHCARLREGGQALAMFTTPARQGIATDDDEEEGLRRPGRAADAIVKAFLTDNA